MPRPSPATPGRGGHVGEPAAAVVAVEDVGLAVERRRGAPYSALAGRGVAVEGGLGGVEVEVVGDEEVEVAVAVVVDEGRARGSRAGSRRPASAVTSVNRPRSFRQSVFGP